MDRQATFTATLVIDFDDAAQSPEEALADYLMTTEITDAFELVEVDPPPPSAEDIAYARAQASEAWERQGGGGL